MSLFKRILCFLNDNKKNIIYFTVIGIIFIFLSTHLSFAAGTGTAPASTNTAGSASTTPGASTLPAGTINTAVVDMVNGLAKMAGALLGALTFLVGLFLYPGWTSGSVVGLTDPLKTMWIMISNVVYFIFAFIFIWIAFMNILGKEDGYQLKKSIPRFIVGVLIVPFSWFFVQFVISLSNILTVGVLSLPYDTFKNTEFFSDANLEQVEFCKKNIIITSTGSGTIKCDGNEKISLKQIIDPQNSDSLYGLAAFYTYGVMKVDSNGFLYQQDVLSGGIRNIFDLNIKLILDILFCIVYMLLMIALALALFVRGVMLWVYAMFSPLFGLLFFFKKGGEGSGLEKKFNIKEFINLAMVPVYVAGALAFGLVFLFVAGTGFSKYKTNELQNSEIIKDNGNTIQFGDISYSWSGSFSDSKKKVKDNLMGFEGSFGTLLLQLFGLGILWMALMAALKSSEITGSAVEPIASFGNSIGELIKKAPGYMPIIPAPGGPISSESLKSAGNTFTGAFSTHHSTRGSELGTKAADIFGMKLDEHAKAMDQVNRNFTDTMLNEEPKKTEFLNQLFKATGSLDELAKNSANRDKFASSLSRVVKSDEGKKLIDEIKKSNDGTIIAQKLHDLQAKEGGYFERALGTEGKDSVDDIKKYFNNGSSSSGSGTGSNTTPQVVVESRDSVLNGGKAVGEIHIKREASDISIAPKEGAAMKIKLTTDGTYSKILNNSQDIQGIKDLLEKAGVKKSDITKVLEKIFNKDEAEELYKKMYP